MLYEFAHCHPYNCELAHPSDDIGRPLETCSDKCYHCGDSRKNHTEYDFNAYQNHTFEPMFCK